MGMTTDPFSLLGLEPTAALDPAVVRQVFQERAAAVHPDHGADAEDRAERTALFASLNEAQRCLSSTPQRLRVLLQVRYPELAASHAGAAMDGAFMELFGAVGAALEKAKAVQSRRAGLVSALARAMLMADETVAADAVMAALGAVNEAMGELERSLPALDETMRSGEACGPQLKAAAARAGFLEKWQAQLRAAHAGAAG